MSVWSTDDFITHQSIFQSNFGNLLLPILLRKQKQKKNHHKSLQQFTHYLQPCSYPASPLTKWHLSKPTLLLVPRVPFLSPLTQGHCISKSPLFASSNLLTLLCHSIITQMCYDYSQLIKISWLHFLPICLFPFTYISNFHPPISWTHFTQVSPHPRHHNWACEVTSDLLIAKSVLQFSALVLRGHHLPRSLSFL